MGQRRRLGAGGIVVKIGQGTLHGVIAVINAVGRPVAVGTLFTQGILFRRRIMIDLERHCHGGQFNMGSTRFAGSGREARLPGLKFGLRLNHQ